MAFNNPVTQPMDFTGLTPVRLWDSDNSNYFGLKAPSNITSSVDYVVPAAPPASNGYVLSCTTAGVMSWVANGSVSSANFTPSTGLTITSGSGSNAVLAGFTLAVDQTFTASWTGKHTWTRASGNTAIAVRQTGDTQDRFFID